MSKKKKEQSVDELKLQAEEAVDKLIAMNNDEATSALDDLSGKIDNYLEEGSSEDADEEDDLDEDEDDDYLDEDPDSDDDDATEDDD